jgi:Flp pilus assembly pilin Flp
MLRNFLKNRKAQNTAEYALLIALVVAGVIAMQTYAQRAMQGRIHDASVYLSNNGGDKTNLPVGLGNSVQYEPYYMKSSYNVASNSTENKRLAGGLVGADSQNMRSRAGSQQTTYDNQTSNPTLNGY